MLRRGKVWTVCDRYGDEVYLTWERWGHITSEHVEMENYFDELQVTICLGRQRRHPLQVNNISTGVPFLLCQEILVSSKLWSL